ncbi:MAG TPA: DUF354 domain-containing protein [Ignisphaera sp.]|nr:DUF354 domain-containing protein [Ignisphaera sp.]
MIELKKLWIDILTPKQARLLGTIARELMNLGYDVIVTARDYEYTLATLDRIGIPYRAIGGYAENLKDKLVTEAKRIIDLLTQLPDFDAAIAFPNPVAARISFGLGKPYIALTDSPHSIAPSRLSLPLAQAVVFSICIPRNEIRKFIYREHGVILEQFRGVDEVQWLKEYEPDKQAIKELDLEPYTYVVIRPPEVKASYYRFGDTYSDFRKLISTLLNKDLKILYLPRYSNDPIIKEFSHRKEFVIPSRSLGIEGPSITYYAIAVVTGGGTLAREAALMGTPGISLFPRELYVNKCVKDLGFPLYQMREVDKALTIIDEACKNPDRYREEAERKMHSLETPLNALLRVFKELEL